MKKFLKKMRKLLSFILELAKYILIYPIAKILYMKRNIFIVAERGNDARDNGYHFFKYLCENHPEIEKYYIIDKKSADYEKIKQYNNVVQYKSFKHYLFFIASKYKISTHIFGYSTYSEFYYRCSKWIKLYGYKIFLQHGVTKDDLPQLYKDNTNVNLFICGAEPEYKFVLNKFNYDKSEVKYTGLARYDSLYKCSLKNQILVMPTWRNYLSDVNYSEFKNSDYCVKWNSLLNNKKLQNVLEQKKINLIFYPHIEMQKFIKCFKSPSKWIKIAMFNEYDVQTLLKESKLLVTDYSSVFFDFAYMEKPQIYYQFDEETYRNKHYGKGYFEYKKDGFGKVENLEDEIVTEIISNINQDFILEEKYLSKINKFFTIKDTKNCERIFNEIKNIGAYNE